MGIATVVTSGKGGVGKSTISVGVGRALAERGRRVLLVDCDAGLRSLDRMVGIDEALVFDTYDVVYARCAPIEAIYPCASSDNLFLLPAPSNAEDTINPQVMKRLVSLLKEYYDHVILDCPAGVGSGFKIAVCSADRALVVCNPDPVCVRGLSIVNRMLSEYKVENEGLVINRFNGEFFSRIDSFDDLDAVIDAAETRLLGVVPEDFSCAASFLKGKKADPKDKGMMALTRIAGRLEGETIPLPVEIL